MKLCDKVMKKVPKEFLYKNPDYFNLVSDAKGCDKDTYFITTTSASLNKLRRDYMVLALDMCNTVRTAKEKWTETTAICFMHEVMNLTDNSTDEIKEYISKKYAVPVSTLNTQVALFINNYERGSDKYCIDDFFTRYEILAWKYRDLEKLQNLVETNQIDEKQLNELKEYGII